MHATENRAASLAGRRLASAEAPERKHPLQAARDRLDALRTLFGATSRKPDKLYEIQRGRHRLPDEAQRVMIHDGIRAGTISPEQITTYRLFQLQDDLAQFSAPVELRYICYVTATREKAEALEAQAVARTQPTREHCEEAVRQTREDIVASQAFVSVLESRDFVRPMGVRA